MRYLLNYSLLFLLGASLIQCKNIKCSCDHESIHLMKKVADWQLAHPKWEKYEWQNAPLYDGVWAVYQTTGEEKYLQACLEMGEENQWAPGKRWYHADDIAIGHVYLDLYKKDKKELYINKLRDSINRMFDEVHQFDDQELPPKLKEAAGDKKINLWWWCDAIYMGPPTLVKLGVYTGEDKYLNLSDSLYRETHNYLWDEEEHLYARDLRFVHNTDNPLQLTEKNGEKIFWSRGNGWVIGGLAMMLSDLSKEWPTRSRYEDIYRKLATRLAAIQPEDGLWRSSLLDTDYYEMGESSGSSFILYGLAWGINNGYLDKAKYGPVVQKTWKALKKLVSEDGMLGYAQPVGEEPLKNFEADDWEVYASGAFCLAAAEMYSFFKNDCKKCSVE